LSMIIGTLLAHNVVANWAVTLAVLYFLARWWRGRRRAEPAAVRTAAAGASASGSSKPSQSWLPAQEAHAGRAADAPRSRWTADKANAARGAWR
jgi:hypothetical protein